MSVEKAKELHKKLKQLESDGLEETDMYYEIDRQLYKLVQEIES